MGLLVTLQNHRSSAFPVDERSYVWAEGQPHEGEFIHLHDQGRLVRVDRVVWMATEHPLAGSRSRKPTRPGVTAAVVVVTGTEPTEQFSGRYS
jgi:hypothetical protein